MQPVVYVDLRCLQDLAYRHRGIGYHTAALLRTRSRSRLSDWKAVGLVDPRFPKLLPEFASLVDETSYSVNPCCNGAPAVFLDGSPMTHDMRFGLRFQDNPRFFTAAVVYDFIPLDWPGYLPTVAKRIEYLSRMARMKHFDLFFPISQYTAWRLSELLGVSSGRIRITGASVRRSLYELRERLGSVPSPYGGTGPYFVTLGGDDKRKNTEVAVTAVRRLNLLYSRRIALKVLGHYGEAYKRDLLQLAGHPEGMGFVEFHSNISDEALVSLHAGALAAIAPSQIEGFSLPVAEASVCGCPVIASTCAAQLELIDQMHAIFPADDAVALSEKLETLLHDPSARAALVREQSHLGRRFHEEEVGKRCWTAIASALELHSPPVRTRKHVKPRVAFLSPFPPDNSDAASYTAMAVSGGEHLFHSDLYTDTARPLTFDSGFRDVGAISVAPLLNKSYNAVISVLGNSPSHSSAFDIFERYGGPCILHDVRLTEVCFHRLGHARFREFASRLLGRPVSPEEPQAWLQDRNLPFLFVEPIIERALPLMVHTATQQELLRKRYGAKSEVLPCCPTILLNPDELKPAAKEAAREKLGIPAGTFLISAFRDADRIMSIEFALLAVDLLCSWNIPAALYVIGSGGMEQAEAIRETAQYGLSDHVHYPDDSHERDFLIASDAAVQLQSSNFGRYSTAVINCIGAELPSVTTKELAEACDAPGNVSTVPNRFSPLQVAEQLALIWDSSRPRDGYADEHKAYLATHNFEHYGKRLIEILGIA